MARQPAGGKRPADPEFPPAWLLLQQTARETKNVPSILSGPLLHAIITGIRYPEGLYAAVMRRIRADSVVNYPRACLIKGYLNRNLNKEVSMSLDSSRADPAYRLGRLFATLEKTQQDALGGNLNKTIRDSFYSSASATPGSVFPRLLRTYQHHIAKLEGGRRVNREKLIQEILDPLGTFPTHLGLPDQGLFAIGYYHQTRDFYAKRGDTEQS
jgi:CRISPR-associated protein Csd1